MSPDLDRTARAVLITGCSSGIGRATAERLVDSGWSVYATARRPESIADLAARGAQTLALDVTDRASMEAAVKTVEEEHGAVGVLVNNAGFGLTGAAETTPIEEARRQFDTNFFGLAELTQLCLPGMRAQRYGRVVNISSMGGRLSFPGQPYYHASKHALEAYSDVLRFEVRPFGVAVILIEPGLIKTEFDKTAVDNTFGADSDGPYARYNANVMNVIDNAYKGILGKAASGPERIARVIEKAISSGSPRSRYVAPLNARMLLLLRALAPDRLWDAALTRVYTPPKPEE